MKRLAPTLICSALGLLLLCGPAWGGFAKHKVAKGDSLNGISKKYGCSIMWLRKQNKLKNHGIRIGQVLNLPRNCTNVEHPPRILTIRKGHTLGKLAKKYKCTVKQLKKANGLRKSTLSLGARLQIPDCSKPVSLLAKASKRAKNAKRKIKRFHMNLSHVNTKEKTKGLWVVRHARKNKNRQWIGKKARKTIERFLRDWKYNKRKAVPERLIWQLYLVAQHFDAEVEIVSGYRSKERDGSRHTHGKAVDFRIKGVDPKVVWEYCKRFDKTGLGWYPTSRFTHMDVRDKSYYWIDDSGPGQKSRYRKGVSQRRPKATRSKERLVKAPTRKARKAKRRKKKKASVKTAASARRHASSKNK